MAVDQEAAGIRDAVMAEQGQKTVSVPPEALAKWQTKTEPVVAAWADSRKNGKEVLDKYRALYAQAAAECRTEWRGSSRLARVPPCLIKR
jgi:hypothetical protein